MSEEVWLEKIARMREVYEREKALRESAKYVYRHGEVVPRPLPAGSYVESATAASLCRIFEENEEPWWAKSA
jgi:hypothetical protein